jgi:hypothetical protein
MPAPAPLCNRAQAEDQTGKKTALPIKDEEMDLK